MSGSTAIGLVSKALQDLLNAKLLIPDVKATLLSPDEVGGARSANLFLYKVQENPLLKNMDWQARPDKPGQLMPPPLSLNLFYLLTAYAATTDSQTGGSTAHAILGDAMRVLYEHPIIPADYLPDDLQKAREQIKVMLAPMDMEELGRVWSTFGKPFRPSALYEVAVVQLDMSPGRERPLAKRVEKIAVPQIAAPFAPPILAGVAPLRLGAGAQLTVSGEHLAGWRATVRLMGQQLLETGKLTEDTFTVTVPDTLAPGLYDLQVDIDTLCRQTFFFEVIAS
ncbi:MAG: Pvc16 family protein [Chloroflexales bacterium]